MVDLLGFFELASDKLEGREAYTCMKYLEKTQWMSKADLQKLQFKRLKRLLIHAFENVPHYRESFKRGNFRPYDFNSFDDAQKVPILKKSTIREELDTLLARNVSSKKLVCGCTSGTTAFPVRFYRGKKDLSWASGAELRAHGWAGYKIGDKQAVVWAYPPERTRNFKFKLEELLRRSRVARTRLLNVVDLSEESMDRFAVTLHRFKPSFIRGYTYSLNLFAAYLLQNNRFRINPRAISTVSSTLFPHYRKAIEKAFNCKVYDHYGCNEVGCIAAQCGEHEGLHVSEENVFLEIVEGSEPINVGEEGEVLLTNLHSYNMPYIRYKIGDSGKMLLDACSCGRGLSLMKLKGRTYEYFVNSDGSFTSLRDFDTVFEDLPIREFQVVQESFDEIVIKIVGRPGYNDSHTEFIEKNIKLRGLASVRVELVDSIPLDRPGKPRYIVSKIPTKYT